MDYLNELNVITRVLASERERQESQSQRRCNDESRCPSGTIASWKGAMSQRMWAAFKPWKSQGM
jgi:hypothetical protein